MGQADVLATRTAFRDELRRDLMTRANDFYRDLSELAPVAEVPTGDESNGHSDLEHVPAKVAVLTRRAFTDLVNEVFEIPLPPPSEHYAEVSTPAKVIVAAECPRCGIAQPIEVAVSPELLVDPDGSELRVKTKMKGRTHVCGQLPLPDAPPADDPQLTLDGATPVVVIDIIPDAPAPTDLLDDDSDLADCKANGIHGENAIQCYRPLDHDGDHYDAQLEATWRVAPAIATVLELGEAIAERLPDVDEVLAGEADGSDLEEQLDALLPGGPALECDGSNHVPGCAHFVEGGPEPSDLDDLPF